jgi:GT2 family glycosyltransferase
MKDKMVYIILPIHNSLRHVEKFVKCLNKQTHKNIVLLVVDCGSNDGGAEYIVKHFKNCEIYPTTDKMYWGQALRFAWGVFTGVGYPLADAIVIMNVDATFDKNYINVGIDNLQHHALVVSTAFENASHTQMDGGVHVDWYKLSFELSDKDKNIASTRGLFMEYEDFIESGGFHKKLPHYHSDYEFTHRLVNDYGYVIKTPKNLILFSDGASTGIHYPKNLKELFSIKCPHNPIYKSRLILACSPVRYWAINLLRAWAKVFKLSYWCFHTKVKWIELGTGECEICGEIIKEEDR